MIVAGRAVVHGHMTLGDWVAVQSWIVSIFAPLNFLGKLSRITFELNIFSKFIHNVTETSYRFRLF